MATFVLEIGTEELPARFLKDEQESLKKIFTASLDENSLAYDKLQVFTTPRRAVVKIDGLNPIQQEKTITIQGPAKKIAYDAAGQPTKALNGFLAANNAGIADVCVTSTEKGEYITLHKKIGGKNALEVLSEICPTIIKSLSFAKSMHWGDHHLIYARPVRWILALFDSEVVRFKIEHLSSDRQTCGHRVHGPGPFAVPDAESYEKIISDSGNVIIDPEKRREIIIAEGNKLAEKHQAKILWKDSLLDEVQGLGEMPVAMLGEFDTKFLELPPIVLLTSMESHQKSFGVEDASGKLLPYFLTILNLKPADPDIVKRGWEKVLRARLEDARFFWNEDLKCALADWNDKLQRVIFIGPLGTMSDKKLRLEELCAWLANETHLTVTEKNDLIRAANLSKADLVSGMVGEFDSLQGIMGGIYAEKKGENKAVAQAIQEQYLPTGPDSPLPQTLGGALLSIADKMDTLTGCFGMGIIPTGAADPNGLRRCALGIIRILLSYELNISLYKFIEKSYEFYGNQKWKLDIQERFEKIQTFFRTRLRNYFQGLGYDTVLIDTVLAAGIDNIPDCARRLASLSAFAKTASWIPTMQAMKRIDNILHKNKEKIAKNWNESLLIEPAEISFVQELKEKLPDIDDLLANHKYGEALEKFASFVPALNTFFEKIMVMSEDENTRLNRMALLDNLRRRFAEVARISDLQI